jgi:cytoskeletal protein CcmA (bactofilin family)
MFGKKSTERGAVARERVSAALGVAAADGAISIIGAGMRIVGDLVTDGTVRVEGRVEGTIRAGKAVVLGKGGEVVGDIFTQDAVIGGRVQGRVFAESRLELQSTSEIGGEIRARTAHLQLDEGARFNGQIQMVDEDGMRALPAAEAPRE